jgi:alpha-L-rhamnosidase
MHKPLLSAAVLLTLASACVSPHGPAPATHPSYAELRAGFAHPDHARWGEVPLWWWEGDRLDKDRVRWQLETLAAKGVKAVCPIQRSPGRCYPSSFTPEWWEMFEFVHTECKRLGMALWAYDQLGYGHYGWLEMASAKADDPHTRQIKFVSEVGDAGKPIRVDLPEGTLLAARAFPVVGEVEVASEGDDDDDTDDDDKVEKVERLDDARSIDVTNSARGRVLEWSPPAGRWRVSASVATPYKAFRFSRRATGVFVNALYGELERRMGKDSLGKSFVGIFQDEHAITPRDIYTAELAGRFERRFGYPITRAIPALHFDVGAKTPKYRNDYFDAYLALDEELYWSQIYKWTHSRGLLTSHDNWGRQNINRHSEGYIDYFRTQRWYSAPGFDDYGVGELEERNYYDTKIAASIARLYGRQRVWNEAFHSSGWGRTTDQTLSWLSHGLTAGANLYDEHGLYYSTRASTWEHAAPDPHWRQPYWRYYKHISDWVARTSYVMSQGIHVVDVAVHYPVVSVLAGQAPGVKGPDNNTYMSVSRAIYDAGIDNDIIDDDSILRGTIRGGRLHTGGNAYQALVFGPQTTMRRSVLAKAARFVRAGGTVLFFRQLPRDSSEGGRGDHELAEMLEGLLGTDHTWKRHPGGGFAAFVPSEVEEIPTLAAYNIDRDFTPSGGKIWVTHRRIGSSHVYLVQNATDEDIELRARCRVDAVPELWDPFTGKVSPVDRFVRTRGSTVFWHKISGNVAHMFVFREGAERTGGGSVSDVQLEPRTLPDAWKFSVEATRDNRWGEFRWPPSDVVIGPEVRRFRYAEETKERGIDLGWNRGDFDDTSWPWRTATLGPYWLSLGPLAKDVDTSAILPKVDELVAGLESSFTIAKKKKKKKKKDDEKEGAKETEPERAVWTTVTFSKTLGRAVSAPWGGHSRYPDGAVDQNFIKLREGRNLIFTRLHSIGARRLGLRVELRNSTPRLWVNGIEQPFEDAIGNLPLRDGENTVLLDIPDGGEGMAFVQKEPPTVASMADAAKGILTPDLAAATWVWGGESAAAYLRKSFSLDSVPAEARLTISAYTGYRLFVNGVKLAEEIGPWANWEKPESFSIAKYLRKGENIIAVWAHVHPDIGEVSKRGVCLAVKMRTGTDETEIFSDASFRGSTTIQRGWTEPGLIDSVFGNVIVLGKMGVDPWGMTAVENIGSVTEPHRKLAIDLPSPYLTCFDEVSDVVYDVKPEADRRVGWYRFVAPPGLRRLRLGTKAGARAWVNGVEAKVENGTVDIAEAPSGISTVALRLEMERGSYAGAAFPKPLGIELDGGTIQLGEWSKFGLPTYSGVGVYKQDLEVDAARANKWTELDLGHVLVAAEVLINGESIGVRLARPFRFDVTGKLRPGTNTIEIRVANTIAPHYTVTRNAHNLGPTASGLIGPVRLIQRR